MNLAPNGKPSNLTPEQYRLVRTPAFKNWFGDWENDPKNASKVVDENGEPLVVYHGTRSDDFYEFENKLFGYRGFYFTDKKSVARNYGSNIRQFFLNSKNFVSEDMKGGNYSDNEWIDDLVENSEMDNKDVHLLNFIDPLDPSSMERFPISNIYIIFNKSNIKLADGTNTTFDANNPDIRFGNGGGIEKLAFIQKLGGTPKKNMLLAPNGKPSNLTPEQYKLVRTPAFKKWFGDWENDAANSSKVVDKNGEPLVVYRGFPKKIKENIFSFKRNLLKQPLRQKNTFCFYFTDNKEVAEEYGKDLSKGEGYIVKPYFLNIRNLFDIKGFNYKLGKGNTNKKRLLDQLGISKQWYEKNIIRARKNNSGFDKWFYDRIYDGNARKYYTPDEYYEMDVKKRVGGYIFDKIEPIWAFFTDIGIYPYSNQKEFRYMIHDYKKFDGVSYLESTHSFGLWSLNVQKYSKTYGVFEGQNIKLADGTNTTFDGSNPDIRFKTGGSIRKPKKRTISQTPAPKKDRIYGSKINKPKSSESKSKASSIILSPSVIKSIRTKINQHNEEYPNKKIPLSSAKAVVRRGMGAYSSTHRPTISGGKPNSRVAWGLARLNAFIYKIVKGKSKSGKYKQDDDLINELGYRVKPYAYGGQITDEQKETYKKWKELVNMSRSELEKFYNSEEGKVAGLSPSEAKKAGIDSGRESARWIMKMKYVPVKEWNSNMWRWAKKQISFISRMSGVKGKLYDEKGRKTRKHLALLIWGHNPEKQ